jgi:phage-related protein
VGLYLKVYAYEYYKTRQNEQPLRDWINTLPVNERATIRQKIQKLAEEGLKLLRTNMLKPIEDYGNDFYELIGGQLRIGIYLDRSKNTFILLHGWRKQRKRQPKDIDRAFSRLKDYLSC